MLLANPITTTLLAAASDVAWQTRCALTGTSALRLGEDVEVRPSPGKGLGVFALRDIADEAVVARYSGRLYSRAAFDAAGAAGETSGDYALELMPGWIIDGEDSERSSWARYINHSLRRRNCFAFSGPGFVYFRATKAIPKGGELFFQYGDDYWEDRAPERSWRRIAIDLL
tara:strand:- start:167 stop:679 length:513 start_codon:yes stop_codon:yes gene_type:complete